MVARYISQTFSTAGVGTGDLTNEITDARIALLCPTSTQTISTTAVFYKIRRAEAEVDSILGPGFTVPMTGTIPDIVTLCAVDICVYYMYEGKDEFRTVRGENPVKERYARACKTLERIKAGAQDLGNDTTHTSLSSGSVYVSTFHFITEANETTSGATGGF